MNEITEKDVINIENMIYEINGKEVMFDFEISRTKCHNRFYDMRIVHYDIGEQMSKFDNYAII